MTSDFVQLTRRSLSAILAMFSIVTFFLLSIKVPENLYAKSIWERGSETIIGTIEYMRIGSTRGHEFYVIEFSIQIGETKYHLSTLSNYWSKEIDKWSYTSHLTGDKIYVVYATENPNIAFLKGHEPDLESNFRSRFLFCLIPTVLGIISIVLGIIEFRKVSIENSDSKRILNKVLKSLNK